jgi:hypothetical protein
MPANAFGKHIDPTAWNGNDGFSPGSLIIAHVPGVDLAQTGAAPITDMGASLDDDAPIVLLDADTGERWPYWAELDANDPQQRPMLIHPARNLAAGHRYIVALRDMRDAQGRVIPPGDAFAGFLRGRPQGPDALARLPHMKQVLARLSAAGVSRHDLHLAWDFTVASTENLTGRAVSMRDQAFAQLGDAAPAFRIEEVTDFTEAQDSRILRHVRGTFDVPSILDRPGGPPGSRLNLDADGTPRQLAGNVQRADFVCNIPRSAAADPAYPSLYGHGLLGRPTEINAGNVKTMSNTHNFLFCATSWIGMANDDIPNVGGLFSDFSNFESVPSRSQQGLLDFQFLGRLMTHPDGFAADPAFQDADGSPFLDLDVPLAYDGNSQGGIMGGALMALAQDIPRGVLGVTGMNYSTLINRSVDAEPFFEIMDVFYPDKLDQQLIFSLIQMLWDRGEANGYAAHIRKDPLPGTPTHEVLMHVAFGDHQVAPVSAAVEARTIGAAVHRPVLKPGRSPEVEPYWDIPGIPSYPYDGSALVVWDDGTPHEPLTNTPPDGPEYGEDPHEVPRAQPAAQLQKATFLRGGGIIDVCGGAPCVVP